MPTLADYEATRRMRFPVDKPANARHISVITVCLDAVQTIGRAIASVQAQAGLDIEHIIVDGASRDGTVALARSRLRLGDFLLSEPDRGISDALNKGVALASGLFIQLVHSDDWLAPGQLELAFAAIQETGADFVFGDLLFHEGGRPSFRYDGDPGYAAVIHRRMPNLNHPTVLARRPCFERVGLFDPRYRCAMDYDWFMRLHQAGARGVYVPGLCGNITHDGVSNLRYRRTLREVAEIAVRYGHPAPLAYGAMAYHLVKTSVGRVVKQHAMPLYRSVRRQLNASYRPLD